MLQTIETFVRKGDKDDEELVSLAGGDTASLE